MMHAIKLIYAKVIYNRPQSQPPLSRALLVPVEVEAIIVDGGMGEKVGLWNGSSIMLCADEFHFLLAN